MGYGEWALEWKVDGMPCLSVLFEVGNTDFSPLHRRGAGSREAYSQNLLNLFDLAVPCFLSLL